MIFHACQYAHVHYSSMFLSFSLSLLLALAFIILACVRARACGGGSCVRAWRVGIDRGDVSYLRLADLVEVVVQLVHSQAISLVSV